ncbi:MAG: hypothetical protein LUD50_07590 [Clostridia bacterium]|nr:hypothetical protein [Clostridia bacterium]
MERSNCRCYKLSDEAKALSVQEISEIRDYIYKCSKGDDEWAGHWFVMCMEISFAADIVLDLAREGKTISKDRLSSRIFHAND